jgi:hypothetical protein
MYHCVGTEFVRSATFCGVMFFFVIIVGAASFTVKIYCRSEGSFTK